MAQNKSTLKKKDKERKAKCEKCIMLKIAPCL